MFRPFSLPAVLLLAVFSSLLAIPCRASLVFTTPSGSIAGSDGAVSAEADFTLGNGTIDITLKNLEIDINTSGEAISGLLFNINISPTPKGTMTEDKATFRNFPKKSDPGFKDTLNNVVTRWKLFQGTLANGKKDGSSFTLDALTGSKPQQLIIGDGPYPKKPAASLFEHSPFIALSETFHLKVAGVTSSTIISNVHIQFGTTDGASDHLLTASPPPHGPLHLPEPSTLVMAGLGAAGFLGYGVRRRRTKS
jgi:hypothetical protein